jgi:hypothetical protein
MEISLFFCLLIAYMVVLCLLACQTRDLRLYYASIGLSIYCFIFESKKIQLYKFVLNVNC